MIKKHFQQTRNRRELPHPNDRYLQKTSQNHGGFKHANKFVDVPFGHEPYSPHLPIG